MKKNVKDRHLDVPSEANRDKHINFEALENNDGLYRPSLEQAPYRAKQPDAIEKAESFTCWWIVYLIS